MSADWAIKKNSSFLSECKQFHGRKIPESSNMELFTIQTPSLDGK